MLDCIEVISPKGGVKRTICGLKRQTTIVFYSDKQHYQNKSWQILNRQVGIIIARGTIAMDPRVDCSCLSQSLDEDQGIILKSFTAINIKQSLRKKNLPQSCGHSVIHLSLSFCQMTKGVIKLFQTVEHARVASIRSHQYQWVSELFSENTRPNNDWTRFR